MSWAGEIETMQNNPIVDPPPRALSRAEAEQMMTAPRPWTWYHRFEIVPGVITPGTYIPNFILDKMNLPDDLSGHRVLDLGASDGFFSLVMRHRGAEVVSVDYRSKDQHGFGTMERISGINFDYRQTNIYAITPEAFGTFDIVLFFGVLYHLPDMMKALALIRAVCTDRMFIETQCDVEFSPGEPAARYYKEDTLNNDVTNFWVPNPRCLDDILHDTAFEIDRHETWGDRYFAACHVNHELPRLRKMRLAYGLIG
jgi:tRNA (mo5U34)-methyltransferase